MTAFHPTSHKPSEHTQVAESAFDTLYVHANIATMNADFGCTLDSKNNPDNTTTDVAAIPYGQLLDAAIATRAGKIAWIGSSEAAQNLTAEQTFDLQGRWVTPALIDCHTHLVYGGNRSNEFEARLQGVSYSEIAQQGGGILSTVTATRAISAEQLYQQTEPRLRALIGDGVTTIEIKSGYGLDLDNERKMLQVARKLGQDYGVTIKTTYLAAHALPPEYKDNADDYIDVICEWMPILHAEGLIDAVDAFCENIAFTLEQVTRVFDTATQLGLPIKLHAEQLSNMGGSGLVADFGGLSSDHIEYLSEANVVKMAQAGTVAVLLPAAFYTLHETQRPPIASLRAHGVAMAISTDCNPGTSPCTSLRLAMNMGCTLFALTPEEALAGTTLHAAKALGLERQKGKIAIGYDADLAIWDIDRPADLSYLMGKPSLFALTSPTLTTPANLFSLPTVLQA